MPSWVKVLEEINQCAAIPNAGPIDVVRRRYLTKLSESTNRNTIAYYSGWLNSGNAFGTDINDMDMNGFMAVVHGLDCRKGLDLILHTPGGSISAAEQIVCYLRSKFGKNIRAIIPQIAMSAGTMISCSCKRVIMGKQSSLGPFDPQINGVSARRVLEEFEEAVKAAKDNPDSIPFWQVIIGKYHPTFLRSCKLACERSKLIVSEWLRSNMFLKDKNAKKRVEEIVNKFNDIGHKLDHDRHISISDCKKFGLKVISLEANQDFQDLVLTVHHTFIHTLSSTSIVKAIENQNGVGMFLFKK